MRLFQRLFVLIPVRTRAVECHVHPGIRASGGSATVPDGLCLAACSGERQNRGLSEETLLKGRHSFRGILIPVRFPACRLRTAGSLDACPPGHNTHCHSYILPELSHLQSYRETAVW